MSNSIDFIVQQVTREGPLVPEPLIESEEEHRRQSKTVYIQKQHTTERNKTSLLNPQSLQQALGIPHSNLTQNENCVSMQTTIPNHSNLTQSENCVSML